MKLKRKAASKEPQLDEGQIDDKAEGIKETLSTVLWAVSIALILRTFIFQPFHIPSGSMLPGLMKGDYIITSKYSVGYGRFAAMPLPFPIKSGRLLERGPARGEVIVFRPQGSNKNFIKRVIGLPGDQVQMKSGVLYVNGTHVALENAGFDKFINRFGTSVEAEVYLETLPNGTAHKIYDAQKNGPADNTSVQIVPAQHYFMMGDNRDHSGDSRISVRSGGAGYVPAENIIGRAELILLSANDDFVLLKPWTWWNMRADRWFKRVK